MTKRILLLVLILQGIFISAFSQSNDGYSSHTKKEEIFSESFQDNRNGWRRFYSKIKKGRYQVQTIGNDRPAISTLPIPIDTTRNYQIETEISLEWNRSKELLGIVWNRDLKNGYFFGFNKENKVSVFRREGDIDNVIVLDKSSGFGSEITRYTKYLITIRKVKDEYLIYVNRSLIFKVPAEKQYGYHLGYFVGKASEIQAYNLTVSYLE